MSVSNVVSNLRAFCFKSTDAAVKLAKVNPEKNGKFAKNLVTVKMDAVRFKLTGLSAKQSELIAKLEGVRNEYPSAAEYADKKTPHGAIFGSREVNKANNANSWEYENNIKPVEDELNEVGANIQKLKGKDIKYTNHLLSLSA